MIGDNDERVIRDIVARAYAIVSFCPSCILIIVIIGEFIIVGKDELSSPRVIG